MESICMTHRPNNLTQKSLHFIRRVYIIPYGVFTRFRSRSEAVSRGFFWWLTGSVDFVRLTVGFRRRAGLRVRLLAPGGAPPEWEPLQWVLAGTVAGSERVIDAAFASRAKLTAVHRLRRTSYSRAFWPKRKLGLALGAFQSWGHFSLCHGTSRPVGARHSLQSRDRSGVYLAINPDVRAPIAWECLAPTTPDDTPPI